MTNGNPNSYKFAFEVKKAFDNEEPLSFDEGFMILVKALATHPSSIINLRDDEEFIFRDMTDKHKRRYVIKWQE